MSVSRKQLEERMDFILEKITNEPLSLKDQTQFAILLTLMEICRYLERIWEDQVPRT